MTVSREQLEELAEENGLEMFAYDVLVHGTSHRNEDVRDFIRGVIATQNSNPEGDYSLSLERDPNNEHDSYAIRVLGEWSCPSSSGKRHIGFVPKKLAFKIGMELDDDDPLHALVSSINNNNDGGFDIMFHIAIPEQLVRFRTNL
jgi:hypothetical protein